MAKISARGATKIGSLEATKGTGEYNTYAFTLCSDGRVLMRTKGLTGNKSYATIKNAENRTLVFLRGALEKRGYSVQ